MKALFVLMMSLSLFACSQASSSFPERPENVPDSAVWVGGTDGGVFVHVDKENGAYRGTVYAMGTGAIWYEGPLEYSGEVAFDADDPGLYEGWDGENLYLTNGETLTATRGRHERM